LVGKTLLAGIRQSAKRFSSKQIVMSIFLGSSGCHGKSTDPDGGGSL